MKTLTMVALAASILWSGVAFAEAPVLHVRKSATFDVPAAKVWKMTKDFDGLNAWHPAVAKDVIVEGKNNTVGAVRLLTLQDGGTIKEKLLAFDATHYTFKYSILEGVLPVSAYTSTFVVKSLGKDKSSIAWSGTFKRKNAAANPADNENDKTAVDTISGVYQAGLDNLKKVLAAQ